MDGKLNDKGLKNLQVGYWIIAIALIIIGIIFIVFPETSGTVIAYIVAAALAIWGVFKLIGYFKTDREHLLSSYGFGIGVTLILAAVAVLINPKLFADTVAVTFGAALLIDGVFKLQYAVDLARLKAGKWWVLLILAIIGIVLGMVVLGNYNTAEKWLMIFMGAVLVADGLFDIIALFFISSAVKKSSV